MTNDTKIKILVVEDSAVVRSFLVNLLTEDSSIKVIATAANGEEAVEMAIKYKPDLITMDINLPKLNGFEATEKIMHLAPTPIIIVSSNYEKSNVDMYFDALKAGALAILPTPSGIGNKNHTESVKEFITMVKLMSEIKVIRKHATSKKNKNTETSVLNTNMNVISENTNNIQIIAIGASAGGPPILQEILSNLPTKFNIPIIIVQHVDPTFSEGLYQWLLNTTHKNIKLGENGETIEPGTIYIAPKDKHIGVSSNDKIQTSGSASEYNCRPSVSYLFRSVMNTYGKNAVGILLSGMGVDGAYELKELKDAGAITIAQDLDSSLVYGMPGEAVKLGGVSMVLTPSQISTFLRNLKH